MNFIPCLIFVRILASEIKIYNSNKIDNKTDNKTDMKVENCNKKNYISIFACNDTNSTCKDSDALIFYYPNDFFIKLNKLEKTDDIFIKEYNLDTIVYVLHQLNSKDYINGKSNAKNFLILIDLLILFEYESNKSIKILMYSQIINLRLIDYIYLKNYRLFYCSDSNIQNIFVIIFKQFLKYHFFTKRDVQELFGRYFINKNKKNIIEFDKMLKNEIFFCLTKSILQKLYKIIDGDTKKQDFIKYILSKIEIKRLKIINIKSLNNLLHMNRISQLFEHSSIKELEFDSFVICLTFLIIFSRIDTFKKIETLIFLNTTINSSHLYELKSYTNLKKLVFINSLKKDSTYECFPLLNESLPNLKYLKIYEFNMKSVFEQNIIYFEKLGNLKIEFMTEKTDPLFFDSNFINIFSDKLTHFECRFDFIRLSEIFVTLNHFSSLKTIILHGYHYTYLKKSNDFDISNLSFKNNLEILKIYIFTINEQELYSILNFAHLKTLKFKYCEFDIASEYSPNQSNCFSKIQNFTLNFTKFPFILFTYVTKSEFLDKIDLSYSLNSISFSIYSLEFTNKENITKINLSGKYFRILTRNIFIGFLKLKNLNLSNTTRNGGNLIYILNENICKSLEILKYDKNTIRIEDIQSIENIDRLKYLSLSGCHFINNCCFRADSIPIYTTIKYIDCSSSDLSNKFMKSLMKFKNLRILKILFIKIKYKKFKFLQNSNSNCKILINKGSSYKKKTLQQIEELFSEENLIFMNF
ncbi:hypothetical protein CWI38_0638p0020 [Hamiltosporidium tvaerminnensis]|uniref:Uncharacterized protein n=1 Tax=Hamiltosporidium tvaerminnensis TaxID=1176355 RepID=A0A4V2JXR0_9MICR|nr:hypothetical protein CWI38_0638p0020 [Hamiltosporidium tvaerminnensis]